MIRNEIEKNSDLHLEAAQRRAQSGTLQLEDVSSIDAVILQLLNLGERLRLVVAAH